MDSSSVSEQPSRSQSKKKNFNLKENKVVKYCIQKRRVVKKVKTEPKVKLKQRMDRLQQKRGRESERLFAETESQREARLTVRD